MGLQNRGEKSFLPSPITPPFSKIPLRGKPLRTPRLYKGGDNLTARGKCKIGSFEPVIHKGKIVLINLYD